MTEHCEQTRQLASAYLDNELSATESLTLERHLQECAECAGEVSALAALSSQIKAHARYHAAPPALLDKVQAAIAPAASRPSPASFSKSGFFSAWGQWLGAAAMACLLAGITVWYISGRNAESGLVNAVNAIVASHIRSTLSRQPFDVASSDRHTVKPWFSGKLDFAPPVTDLSAQGFALLGGRLDFVDGQTAAVLVYGRRKHVIDLYVRPNVSKGDSSPQQRESKGYNLVDWRRSGMHFTAVSDLAADELMDFARQTISQAASEYPKSQTLGIISR
jgi:anti-sigma factor RsiW